MEDALGKQGLDGGGGSRRLGQWCWERGGGQVVQSRVLTQCLPQAALSSAWTHLVITTWGKCHWHLAGGGQRGSYTPYNAQESPQQRNAQAGWLSGTSLPPSRSPRPSLESRRRRAALPLLGSSHPTASRLIKQLLQATIC